MELYNKRCALLTYTPKSKGKLPQYFTIQMAFLILQRRLHMEIQQTDIH
jgi:hypothetical protein